MSDARASAERNFRLFLFLYGTITVFGPVGAQLPEMTLAMSVSVGGDVLLRRPPPSVVATLPVMMPKCCSASG